MNFFTEDLMKGTDWRALERAVARMMGHCGWKDVSLIGRSGDMGADIVGVRSENEGSPKSWVVQVKSITGGNYIGRAGIDEVMQAQSIYGAQIAALATNGDFANIVYKRRDELINAGFDVRLWNGAFLKNLIDKWPEKHNGVKSLRPYQEEIINKSINIFNQGGKKVQYIVATGLGKTVIAAEIALSLWNKGLKKILVLCHAQDLALQLEQSFWTHITKNIPTRYFFEGLPPLLYEGVNFGLYQSLIGYLGGIESGGFDIVIVDEAHHAMSHGFKSCVEHLKPQFLVGMTATPWRGDGKKIDDLFGEPIARVSLIDGMAMGFLAEVDYRLYCDNIDWKIIPQLSRKRLSIRDLNKKLFIPQRDEAITAEIVKAANEIKIPKIAIFTPSIEHAKRFASMLSAKGIPCQPLSGVDRVERRKRLLAFSGGNLSAVTAVDVMNEGIDVPDVNILVFLRATHSRRIFIQQLGRGLRIASDKDKVIVLDFVSDIRRMAELVDMDNEAKRRGEELENLYLKKGVVKFSDQKAKGFINEWLKDVTDLSEIDEGEKLIFPKDY